jgi:hypothetical protein
MLETFVPASAMSDRIRSRARTDLGGDIPDYTDSPPVIQFIRIVLSG